jgi:methanethiol S-methyltransferase
MHDCTDARPHRIALLRFVGIAFGISTQAIFLITVCSLFLFLRNGASAHAKNWVTIDGLLAIQFAVVHSVLLLPRIRLFITKLLPAQLYGCLFCLATCLQLLLMFACWKSSPIIVWDLTGWSQLAVCTGFYASWATLFYGLKLVGLGYQSGWTQWLHWLRHEPLPRREFVARSIYRWMRHPVYMSFLGLIWFTPRMTADHAILTAIWTVYVFVGSYLKDQRLTIYLGETYRQYARGVTGYPGLFFGPLGKWHRSASIQSSDEMAAAPTLSEAA